MKVIDPGHKYKLLTLDGNADQFLTFVKRHDPNNPNRFPGNTESYWGTTCQSVLRALLDRVYYLQNQIWCLENSIIIFCLKLIIWLFEFRAARRHEKEYWKGLAFASESPMCETCGHTVCEHNN